MIRVVAKMPLLILVILACLCMSSGQAAPEIRVQGRTGLGVWRTINDGDHNPDQDVVDFGSVNMGSSDSRRFRIQNRGNTGLIIRGISSDSTAYTIPNAPSASVTVPAGEDLEFTIRFSPTALRQNAIITIRNTDANEQIYTFAVTGEGNGPEIQMEGRSFFTNSNAPIENGDGALERSGGVFTGFLGENVDHYFTIQNNGTRDLVISQPDIVSSGFNHSRPEIFSIISLGDQTSINAGDSHDFRIRCRAAEVGTFTARFRMSTNDPDETNFEFGLSANCLTRPRLILEQSSGGGWSEVTDEDGDSSGPPIDIGSVAFGETISRTFRIRNPGTGDLEIESTSSSEADFSFENLTATVPAGGTRSFSVRFSPSSVASVLSHMRIDSNAKPETGNGGSRRSYTFRLSATATEPVTTPDFSVRNTSGVIIENGSTVAAASLGTDFGSMASGYLQASQNFVLFNLGEADLVISDVTFPGGSLFSIDRSQLPITVDAQQAELIAIRVVNRRAPGVYYSTATFESNDLENSPYTIPLTMTLTEPLPGTVENLRIVDGRVKLTMRGSEGVRYRMEHSPDLSPDSWENQNGVAPWTLDGDYRDFDFLIPADKPRGFYRFIQVDFE